MTNRTRRRIGTVVLAPAAALAAWALIRLVGIDLVVSGSTGTVGAGDVLVAALVGALAGSLVVRVLERHSPHPRSWWAFIGLTALAVSIAPLAWRADGASAVGLIALHIVTATVVIFGFASTLPVRRGRYARRARRAPGGDPAR